MVSHMAQMLQNPIR